MQRSKPYDKNLKEVEPDAELVVWEDWVRIRQYEATKLGHRLEKPPVDLAMNLFAKKRGEKEWKTALEYAQKKDKPDVRGTQFTLPARLHHKCYCDPVYEYQRRVIDQLGPPPQIEHICVPKHIQHNEMGMMGEPQRKEAVLLNRDFKIYRENRETALKDKLEKIDPFKPRCSELVVVGKKPEPPPKKIPRLPELIITEPQEPPQGALISVYALKINNSIFFKDIPRQNLKCLEKLTKEDWHESCTTWSYYFNTPISRAGRCKIHFHNLGTVTLRYCWRKIRKSIPFIPEENYEQVFFFNKNEDVIYPGEEKEIYFTFLSNKAGIYSEFWEINFCNICFFDSLVEKLYVNFYADSVEEIEESNLRIEVLKNRIDERAIRNIILDMIHDAIDEAISIKPQQYPYKKLFIEAEIFVMKNPVCFYHQTEVLEMRRLYTELEPTREWDLSIDSWRRAMMDKEYDDRMKYYSLLRQSHKELLKPWYEGEGLAKQKHRTVVFLLGQMADKFDIEYMKLIDMFCPMPEIDETDEEAKKRRESSGGRSVSEVDPLTMQKIQNLFYIRVYDHLCNTVELCAGILSSLDLNRWIHFDFCQ